MNACERMNHFLRSVDLAAYRGKYRHIKLVELDLPRNIQAIRHLYQYYWETRENFPTFEKFYRSYSDDLKVELEEFRRKTMFSEETFYRGLPARTYRTWASLLTQIQGGYVAETIYGEGCVEMSADLDYNGVDIKIIDGEVTHNIQIKKETMSREVRAPWQRMRRSVPITCVYYEIPTCDPKTKTGKNSVPFQRWAEKWGDKLQRLDNGFIIFRPSMFACENITP